MKTILANETIDGNETITVVSPKHGKTDRRTAIRFEVRKAAILETRENDTGTIDIDVTDAEVRRIEGQLGEGIAKGLSAKIRAGMTVARAEGAVAHKSGLKALMAKARQNRLSHQR